MDNNALEPHREALEAIVRATPWLMRALEEARALGLERWCLAAGAVRSAVWDHLHGFAAPDDPAQAPPSDLDLVYFDATNLDPARDRALTRRLEEAAPGWGWEVVNQAGVHLWYERTYGHPMTPLADLDDALGRWPETATAIGVWLEPDGALGVVAPCGLDDLMAMILRPCPRCPDPDAFERRLASKRFHERWPAVRVVRP